MSTVLPFTLHELRARFCETLYPDSLTIHDGAAYWLESQGRERRLVVLARPGSALLRGFQGSHEPFEHDHVLMRCPADQANATALRQALPWLNPVPIGLTTSAGFGDRLGIATPGHARALKQVLAGTPERDIVPVFAQQSIREMTRTRRTPREVMADATWGAFEAGWRGAQGADADHLKTAADIDACAEAGFTLYTIDPGDHVDDEAHDASAAAIARKVEALPWARLESSRADLERRYVGRRVDLGGRELVLDAEPVLRAAAKYGAAIAHVAAMYRHLERKQLPFELEVSVDETSTPTSHVEHAYIASELKRLEVRWVSLAPRYVGRFEKGIDYIGDLHALTEDLAGHAAIASTLGPYKLSLHSGSDKFSVYPRIAELTGGLVHLKTAGTSYLEALRVIAKVDPACFRRIAHLACGHFEADRASYHVSASLERVPDLGGLPDEELPAMLDQTDARQVLHVTFGSVLDRFRDELAGILKANEALHYERLAEHFERHLEPFAGVKA